MFCGLEQGSNCEIVLEEEVCGGIKAGILKSSVLNFSWYCNEYMPEI